MATRTRLILSQAGEIMLGIITYGLLAICMAIWFALAWPFLVLGWLLDRMDAARIRTTIRALEAKDDDSP